jgi:superfamily II DNA/RNA helicase
MDMSTESSIKSTFAVGNGNILPTAATLPFLAISQRPLQRLLFSATLTDNPRKLAMLGINNPLIVRAHLGDSKRRNINDSTEPDDESKMTSSLYTSGYTSTSQKTQL